MPHLFIRTINSAFFARDEGDQYARSEDALALGIKSAAAMAIDELDGDKTCIAIEVRVEEADGTAVLRSVVSLCVAPLMTERAASALAAL